MNKLLINHVSMLRKQYFLTQTDLAKLCGCSKNTISSIERYEFEPSLNLALRLCIALHCKVEDLFEFFEY